MYGGRSVNSEVIGGKGGIRPRDSCTSRIRIHHDVVYGSPRGGGDDGAMNV